MLVASPIAIITDESSPSGIISIHYHHQQQQPLQLSTPTKTDQHLDEIRQEHGVTKPFKTPRRKWFAVWLTVLD